MAVSPVPAAPRPLCWPYREAADCQPWSGHNCSAPPNAWESYTCDLWGSGFRPLVYFADPDWWMRGRDVRFVQNLLWAWGYFQGYSIGEAIDGLYGPKTRTAVQRYQCGHGRPTDGIVAVNTWTSLQFGETSLVGPCGPPPTCAETRGHTDEVTGPGNAWMATEYGDTQWGSSCHPIPSPEGWVTVWRKRVAPAAADRLAWFFHDRLAGSMIVAPHFGPPDRWR